MATPNRSRKVLLGALILFAALLGYFAWRAARPASLHAPGNRVSPGPSRGGELIASGRSEPTTYNRLIDPGAAGELLSTLTQATLVRVNRATDELEPWLAERWSVSPDGLTYTITLRPGLTFSDGTSMTSADVLFTFRALYDPRVNSVLTKDAQVAGRPPQVEAPDPATVIIRLPAPFAPGLRLIESIPILPKHKLEAALNEGRFADAWSTATPLTEIPSLGPFILSQHVSGQRLVFTRNPRYWRKDAAGVSLPYLDTLTMLVIPDQNTEALRMQAGELDLMSSGEIRPEDYAAFKRLSEQGTLRLIDGGIGLDPNLLWFNLSPSRAADPRSGWFLQTAFRHAVSCAVDRQAIANAVYLGAAVPIFGPVTPRNKTWYTAPASPCDQDPAKARELLTSIGLLDRNADGMLEDASGAPARFSILTQRGHSIRERTIAVLQEQLRQVGLTVDLVAIDTGALFKRYAERDFDSVYYGVQTSATDPGLNPSFWLSSGSFHFWNPNQKAPETEWEARIDELMQQQAATPDLPERQRLFAEVQRIFGEHMPAIYFVAPKVTLAVSTRVTNLQPVPQIPQLLWNAESLAVTGPRR